MTKLTKTYFKYASTNEINFIATQMGCPATKKAVTELMKEHATELARLHEQFTIHVRADKAERDKKAAEEKAAKLAELTRKAEEAKNTEETTKGTGKGKGKNKGTKKEKTPKQPEAKLSRKGKTCIVLKQSGKRIAELWIDLESKKAYCDIWALAGTNVTADVTGSQKSERHGNFTQYMFTADEAGRKTARTEFFKIARATKSNIVVVA